MAGKRINTTYSEDELKVIRTYMEINSISNLSGAIKQLSLAMAKLEIKSKTGKNYNQTELKI